MIVQHCSYGFRLPTLYRGTQSPVKVAGQTYEVSDTHYLFVQNGQRRAYLATEHSAACYFVYLENMSGRIEGTEEFNHLDQYLHPDNSPLRKDFDPSWERAPQMLENRFVNCAQYVTALSLNYPGMRFVFLYPGRNGRDVVPTDYGGMVFDNRLFLPSLHSPLGGEDIASLDLDLVEMYQSPWFEEFRTRLMDQTIFLLSTCKLVMAFTSPGFINQTEAGKWASYLIQKLFQE